MGSRAENVGREGGMEGGRKEDREGGRVEERERVESCFLNLNTCVGRVQATNRNVYHRHLHA